MYLFIYFCFVLTSVFNFVFLFMYINIHINVYINSFIRFNRNKIYHFNEKEKKNLEFNRFTIVFLFCFLRWHVMYHVEVLRFTFKGHHYGK